jgi:MOSC domain-containing protein YiiM
VEREGVVGDQHGDARRHGGAEKAVHHYPFEHYSLWRSELPQAADKFARPAFFGENISSVGLTEETVCIGDVFRAGTALLQVSQPRQPCWKLALRAGVSDFAFRVQETGRTGWHLRVLEPGVIRPGDEMELLSRPQPAWPLRRLLEVLFKTPLDHGELLLMARLPELCPDMRSLAQRRLESGAVEPWEARLTIPRE